MAADGHIITHDDLHAHNRDVLIDPAWEIARTRARRTGGKAYLTHKDDFYRLGKFTDWLSTQGRHWHAPDLAAYRDYLLYEYPARGGKRGLAATTVQAHLATIRGRYQQLLHDNTVRDTLYALTPEDAAPSDRKALVDEALVRLRNAIAPDHAPVKVIVQQDRPDDDHLRLTAAQLESLIAAPDVKSLRGLRDTSMLALLACTGLRESELAGLDVADLRQRLDGELALQVREGKGGKARLIPYGDLEWCLLYVDKWLEMAEIDEGAVFRGFWRGEKKIRPGRITGRAVIDVVQAYPVMVDGERRTVNVHDLRRTYARLQYEAGLDILWIKDNLGHADVKTTQGYIGRGVGRQRRAKGMIRNPHRDLERRWA